MSKKYNHLSLEQRYQIEALIKAGHTQKCIATILGVHPSTISREIRRNTPKSGKGANTYWASNAQRRTSLRHRQKTKVFKFTEQMKVFCHDLLKRQKFSPELISNEGKNHFDDFPCHETIYKWIWVCKKSHCKADYKYRHLYRLLQHGHRRRKRGHRHDKRGNIPARVFIDHRPKIAAKRQRLGDLEVDLMIGQKHRSAILACLDRTSRKIIIRKLESKESKHVMHKIIKTLKGNKPWLKTMTFDNDSAFMQHQKIAKALGVKTYFTHPYTSQDKGSVENRIGIIRRFFPKSTDLSKITNKEIREVENLINNRPLKLFNFKTPNQVFSEKIALIT